MCKHILFTNFKINDDLSTLSTFVDRTHDDDGYGAIIRTLGNNIYTLKSLKLAEFYLQLGGILRSTAVRELVVHHRTSTNKTGIDYTHPFEHKGHYLTHNGVVTVPNKYPTKTTNDSEELLHHLIETNYDTETISGYFSCFILNDKTTTVLVDKTAPMHTDGRVYCSHRLDNMQPIELKRITIPLLGEATTEDIKVKRSTYGMDQAHKSLGWGYSGNSYGYGRGYDGWDSSWGGYDDSYTTYEPRYKTLEYYRKQAEEREQQQLQTMEQSEVEVASFMQTITAFEEQHIASSGTAKTMRKRIRKVARNHNRVLSDFDVQNIMEHFVAEVIK